MDDFSVQKAPRRRLKVAIFEYVLGHCEYVKIELPLERELNLEGLGRSEIEHFLCFFWTSRSGGLLEALF